MCEKEEALSVDVLKQQVLPQFVLLTYVIEEINHPSIRQ